MKRIRQAWMANFNYWTQERSLTALLVYLFVGIITWMPLSEENPFEEAIQDAVFNLIILAGYFSATKDESLQTGLLRKLLLLLALSAFSFRLLDYFYSDPTIEKVDMVLSTSFFATLSIVLFKFVVRDDDEVNTYRVQGAVVVYILIGLLCSFLYNLIYLSNQGAFVFSNSHSPELNFAYMVYFSFVVQTTVGAGDIIPIDPMTKSLVIFQSMIGMLYPVVIIARLVSLEIEHTKLKKNRDPKH